MINSILKTKQKVFLKILGLFGVSITLASCYGTLKRDYKYNVLDGNVKSAVDSLPIKSLTVTNNIDTTTTDENGNFSISEIDEGKNISISIKIYDNDSIDNGGYFEDLKDTVYFSHLTTSNSSTNETKDKQYYLNLKNED